MQLPVNNKSSVAVVHLVWVPLGIDVFKRFLTSYKGNSSGYEHELILVFNGIKNESETISFREYAKDNGIAHKSYWKESGFDIAIYFWIAAQLSATYILFLNSYSIILKKNWLIKYMHAAESLNTGVVSATASNLSLYSKIIKENNWLWESKRSFYINYRKYKLLIKTYLLYSFYFKKFPNPHVRTNAFLVKRAVFLTLKRKKIKNKMQAYLFESGVNSLTAQMEKKNMPAFIIDKFGNAFNKNNWRQSNTFWINDQANLLIADNQTLKYREAGENEKKMYTYLAWGNK